MKNQTLRIIGGKWRGRKLSFPSNIAHLRPTSDRIRESLFNWLQYDIHSATCLDLFAGSGALGFEALSRGASNCTFIEQSPQVVNQLKQTMLTLQIEDCDVYKADACDFISSTSHHHAYDIIFLDPPFGRNILPNILKILLTSSLINNDTLIYVEAEKTFDYDSLSGNWEILKYKKTGDVQYGLLQKLI